MFFLSYRRDDSRESTDRIYDHLERVFGARNVFLDQESLQYGTAFPDALGTAIARAEVILVVIGRRWLETLRQRAATDEVDFVREEIRLALNSGNHVLPILVDGADIPTAAELAPFPELRALASLHALRVGPGQFRKDVRELANQLRPHARRRALRRGIGIGVATAAIAAALCLGTWVVAATFGERPLGPASEVRLDRLAVGENAMTVPVRLVYSSKRGDKFGALPVQCSVDDESKYRLPDDLVPFREAYAAEQEALRAAGENSAWNGEHYRLVDWYPLPSGREEAPFSLALRLERGEYYDFVVTHVKLRTYEVPGANGEKISAWTKYVDSHASIEGKPNPALSNYLGVSLTVVTGDGYVVLHRRSGRNAIVPDYMHVSVAEGTSYPVDGIEEPASLVYRAALRGLQEELCLTDVEIGDVEFLGLIYSPELAQFDLSGFVSVQATKAEIEGAIAGCRDQVFENQGPRFVPFNGANVAQAMRDETRWSPFAVASLLLALYHQFGMERTDRDFAEVFAEAPVELKNFQFVPR